MGSRCAGLAVQVSPARAGAGAALLQLLQHAEPALPVMPSPLDRSACPLPLRRSPRGRGGGRRRGRGRQRGGVVGAAHQRARARRAGAELDASGSARTRAAWAIPSWLCTAAADVHAQRTHSALHRPSIPAPPAPPPQIIDDDNWLVLEGSDKDDSDADSEDSNAEGFYAHDYPGGWVAQLEISIHGSCAGHMQRHPVCVGASSGAVMGGR